MKIESIEQIQTLIQLAVEHKLDLLEVDNIKIIKSKHEFPQPKSPPPTTVDEELFNWSSS